MDAEPTAANKFDYIDELVIVDAREAFEVNGRSWSRPDGFTAPQLSDLVAFVEWGKTNPHVPSRDLKLLVVFHLTWSSSVADRVATIRRTRILADDGIADELISTYKACQSITETARRVDSEISVSLVNRALYQEAFLRPDPELIALLHASGSGWSVANEEEGADLDEGDGTGWVYAYTFPAYRRIAEIDDSASLPIKVGMTRITPEARIYGQTRTSHPEDPEILGTWSFADEATAYRVERSFQRRFAATKITGRTVGDEWFNTSISAVEAALSMASDLLGDPTD